MKTLTNKNTGDKIISSSCKNDEKALREKSIYYSLKERTAHRLRGGFKKKI